MRVGPAFLAALAAAMLMGLAGCGGGGGNGTGLPDPTVEFVNSSPDSNPLDFYINTDLDGPALGYLSNTAAVTIKKGDDDVSVNDSTSQTELDAIAFTFNPDTKYIAMTVGLENFGSEYEKRLQLLTFQYDKNPPNGSRARLLIEHGFNRAVGFQTPSIDFQNPGDNPQFKASSVPYAGSSPTTLEVDSGVNLVFQARRAGTENVYASDAGTTFDAGGIYLALVTGVENGTGAEAPQIKYIKLN